MTSSSTLAGVFLAEADANPGAPAIWRRRRGEWERTTARELAAAVREAAGGLRAHAVEPGRPVVVCGADHPDAVAFDLAAQHAGAWTLALPPVLSAADVAAEAGAAGAAIAFCGDLALAVELATLPADERGGIALIVVPDGTAAVPGEVPALTFGELRRASDGGHADPPAAGEGRAFAGFSGGAEPRMVAWRHADVLAAVRALHDRGLTGRRGEVLCHLPFAHPLGRIMGLYAPLLGGGALVFPEAADSLADDLAERSPTVVVTTPRLPEVFFSRHEVRLARTSGVRGFIARRALRALAARPERRGPGRVAAMWAAGRWVRRQLGLGRTRRLVVVLEPLADEVARFFRGLGIEVLTPYGTADLGPLTFGPGGCGRALPGVELRTATDGALEARAGWAAEHAGDGWQATGDEGAVDGDGALTLRWGAAGLESALRASPYIARAVVAGEDEPTRVIVEVEPEAIAAWAQIAGVPHTGQRSLLERPETREALQAEVAARGGPAADIHILPRPLELARGELTWLGVARRDTVAGAAGELLGSNHGSGRSAS